MISYNEMLRDMITNHGHSVLELSRKQNVLLIFLRHFGCTFCKESLRELALLNESNKLNNAQLVLVHMSTEEIAAKYFEKYQLAAVERVADPECKYYTHFGLIKGTFNQLFGFRSWIRGIDAGIIKGYGFGRQVGDGFQMPGVFLVSNGKIISEFKHKYASDKPDYLQMVNCKP